MEHVRIGCGTGGALYHLGQALEVIREPGVEFVSFDLCAERTLAYAQLARLRDPDQGYWSYLEQDMASLLPAAMDRGIRLIGSWGQANPEAAARVLLEVARTSGYPDLRIGVVVGDDVTELVRDLDPDVAEGDGQPLSSYPGKLVSAHAYLGAAPIVSALADGAQVVVTGRVTDSALYLAPLMHHFGWAPDDWTTVGRATIVAHLLECGVQVTGANFADPPLRSVPGLDHLAMPVADVAADGSAVISKPEGSGGRVSELTCKKQLVHEIADPAAYLTPDVAADFRHVRIEEVGPDRVAISGGGGAPPPQTLKVLAALDLGVVAEAQASFAGPRAVQRARTAAEVVQARLGPVGDEADLRVDLIGRDAIFGAATPPPAVEPPEVRLRIALRSPVPEVIEHFRREFDYQWLCVPGISGLRFDTRPALGMYPVMIDRDLVAPHVSVVTP